MSFYGPEESAALEQKAGHLASELSAEELNSIERKRQALAKLFSKDRVTATYKLELTFGKERSTYKHFPGSLVVFRSGSAFNGGGDEPMYPCPNDMCSGFLPPKLISAMLGIGVCPVCREKWPQDQLMEMRLFRLAPRAWARVVARYFIRLNHDADIYLKGHPIDIRIQTAKEIEHYRGGDQTNLARRKRVRVLYPLERIYTDLQHGADLENRFLKFLVA